MIKIGQFEIELLNAGNFALDGGAMFGVVPKTLWQRAYEAGDEQNRISLTTRPLLIKYKNEVIMVDAGNGDKIDDKTADIYKIDKSLSSLHKILLSKNIVPDSIKNFIYTHLHFDHAGGSTILNNGEVEPLFKNAKHFVQKNHFNWALNPTLKDRASFNLNDFMPIVNNNLMEFIEGEGEILPGISVIPVNGHTKSMQLIKISDNGETLLYLADLAPTSAHLKIPYVMGYDNFPLTSIEEKQKILKMAYEGNWTVVFEHDAFTPAGKIGFDGKGYFLSEKILG